jgi:hypothetical protein
VKGTAYHSKCPHCGSNTCGLEACRNYVEAKRKAQEEYERLYMQPPLPPLPKGELIGYRCWNIGTFRTADPDLVEVGGQLAIPYAIVLQSFNGTAWPGPVMHSDVKPSRHNTSGLYVLRRDKQRYDASAHVSGSITLYGKIVEHKDGYRAEHAMVRSLTLHVANLTDHLSYPEKPEDKNTIAQQIAALAQVLERRYECEVLIDSATSELHPLAKFMHKVASGQITTAELEELAKLFGK